MQEKKFIVGLTGGIGSGKTAASDYFATKDINIVDADLVSRLVVEPKSDALTKIEKHFGSEVISNDGTLNRAKLRTIVFADTEKRSWLEGLLHPLIASEIAKQLQESQSPYTILVSPILFESGQNLYTQRNLVIDAPETLQVTRTSKRDGVDEAGVEAIMKAQTNRALRCEKADDIILNDSSLEALHKKIDMIHITYLELAAKSGLTND